MNPTRFPFSFLPKALRLDAMRLVLSALTISVAAASTGGSQTAGDSSTERDYTLHVFDRQKLADEFYTEGATYGDVSGDGVNDIVAGPFWFEGPDFQKRHAFYEPRTFDVKRYSDNFFPHVYDFNGDDWNDILIIGFPGKDASWYENPRGESGHWKRHIIFDVVDNESPDFTDLTGDGRPEIVCIHDGRYGYAVADWSDPAKSWRFVAVGENRNLGRFTHGMGVGDVNGDGRLDILDKGGWYEQPEDTSGEPLWTYHEFGLPQAEREKHGLPGGGGAQMYAYDIDGDGDNDVITSRNAHRWGLFWYENLDAAGDGAGPFKAHIIMGKPGEEQRYDVRFAQMHGIDLVDMDGDGLKDIVTGVRVWAHYGDASAEPPGVVYWFRLAREVGSGVDWIPYRIDDASGVGVMVEAGDVDGDGLPDVVVGNKTGIYFLRHRKKSATRQEWLKEQPVAFHTEGLSPERAAEVMRAPEGFEVHLAAGEPAVRQPVAMTLDGRGRLWIAEAHTYPRRVKGHEGKWNEGGDRIIVLDDTDGDGRFETRKVFAENINLVSGLEVGFGGVFVGAAPYLLFFADADGDDRADGAPRVLLDGFGFQDTHETLNSFIWGPDGWLYGCHGVFTHSRVGKPGTPDSERVPLNAAYWRFHPERHDFEVFAWGTSNPWGIDFDDHGQAFSTACVIPHLYHVVQGARYQRQAGRHFHAHVYDDIKTIADHRHYAGNIRDHAWWGHEPLAAEETLARGGGHAHCGAMIYLGDAFPESYRGRLFMNNIHGNRVNIDILERRGSGFVGRHGDDFVVANNLWHRGINLKYGPDGEVYLIDWYDRNACHRTNPVIWDRSNGRVFRIRYRPGGKGLPERELGRHALASFGDMDSLELARLQVRADNDWWVRVARRRLQEHGASDEARAFLARAARTHAEAPRALRALWALHVTGGVSEELSRELLRHSNHEYVRGWIVQLACEQGAPGEELLELMERAAREDPSPVVRLYLASALQRLPASKRWNIASGLVGHEEDGDDHNLPLLIWYGVEPLVAADVARAMELAARSRIPLVSRYLIRRAATDASRLDVVIDVLNRAEDTASQRAVLAEIENALRGQAVQKAPPSWRAAFERLIDSPDATVRGHVEAIAVRFGDRRVFPRLRAVLADRGAPIEQRKRALTVLVDGKDSEAAPIVKGLLDAPRLRGEALRALASFDAAGIPEAILSRYPSYSTSERIDAVTTLASRPVWARTLLEAVRDEVVPRTDVSAFVVRQIQAFGDAELTALLEDVWGRVQEASADKLALIAEYKAQLTPQALASANLPHGRSVYARTCESCHKLFGQGGNIAPDLTGSNRANIDYLLENLVDPNAVVGKDYQLNLFITRQGRAISGLVAAESDSALTIQTPNDQVVVPRADILQRSVESSSLMPEGMLGTLTREERRDLFAYLASPTQVPLGGTPTRVDPRTHRVPGAIEGEKLRKLDGTPSDGVANAQDMRGFGVDRWSANSHLWWRDGKPGSHLALEVPVPAAGNYRFEVALTRAPDYGIVQLSLDGEPLGGPIDLYDPAVVPTGTILLGEMPLQKRAYRLGVEIVGANPRAIKRYMFGLDYVLLKPVDG